MADRFTIQLGKADAERLAGLAEHARRDAWAERLSDRDPGLWSEDPGVRADIAGRLGWLGAPDHFTRQIPALEAFGDRIRVDGFTTAVVMGMGGSSLAPEVLHRTFGSTDGYLDLRILDSTDPAAVAATVDDLDPLRTLWIVASKSGTTTEPLAFLADRWAGVARALTHPDPGEGPWECFVAITDPGRSLEAIPHALDFRERFLNLPDVGGRYSALTYVGLVPASLIGLDLDPLLASATAMVDRCREPDPGSNPGLQLGLTIGSLARAGRDKLTFLADDGIASFGAWLEQLLAESTGKQGTGIVPIDLEPVAGVSSYGPDRTFVRLALSGSSDASLDGLAAQLASAGHPVARIEIDDPMDLGGEFVRWEVATAFAGAVLGINPFDQPNVEEAKERTRRVLEASGKNGPPEEDRRASAHGGVAGAPDDALPASTAGEAGLIGALRSHLARLGPPSYVGIQAFIAPSAGHDAAIARVRSALVGHLHCATTAGYGPRFLHSTGQLHKGGPATGVFVQLTSDHPVDRPIPDWPYTFGRLIDAQARGDREALRAHARPVLHVHLGADLDAGLEILEQALAQALR
jgi:transaldolase/glucose-6-phosphate isomerase